MSNWNDGKLGDRKSSNGVELEHNGLQWVPLVDARNYPKLFDPKTGLRLSTSEIRSGGSRPR